MGNSSSSSGRGHQDDLVDYGHLTPQGVYTGVRDWNHAIVSQLICARKLAPFYRPLEDYDESWDDDQILAARKELPQDPDTYHPDSITRIEASLSNNSRLINKKPASLKEPSKPEAAVYRGAVECPICFLYYPPNINRSRCCDQNICTECFVQIKRSEPTTTHLVSDPAACPYCVQDNFGVVYTPPPWRSGIGSEPAGSLWSEAPRAQPSIESTPYPTHKRRQKSFGPDSPEVVTTDQIRPDWEAKLAAVRAAVTRRANRRIIMRQVGDRLIPVGVTSGRVHALTPEEAAQSEVAEGGGSRRSRRRQQQPQAGDGFDQFMGSMGLGGHDLEELMIMEAMRLSLIDQEEQQKKDAEEKKKMEKEQADNPGQAGPSTLEGQSTNQGSGSSSSSSHDASPVDSSVSPSPQSTDPASGENLSAQRTSSSATRSRTPSPAPPSQTQTLLPHTANWRPQTPNPSPFSTLNAALSAATTATAILNHSNTDVSTSSTSNDTSSAVAPIITISNDAATQHDSNDTTSATSAEPINSSRPEAAPQTDSFASSVFSAYDNLPSSPDTSSHLPLLGESQPGEASATKATTTPEERTDYFG